MIKIFFPSQSKYCISLIFHLISLHFSLFFHAQITIKEKVLEKQLKQGTTLTIDDAGAALPKIPFETEELEATAQLAEYILKSNGFKDLSSENFNLKVKNIFGRIIDPNSQSAFLYVNYLDKCNREIMAFKNNRIDYEGTFIDKKRKIITDFYYIPELIDYQKEYPELNDIESNKIIRKSSIDNLDIEIPHWKDVPNLKEIRKKNVQTIVARNMYLLNDNKAQYKWLILNDQQFMESLVKNFGYTQDAELLKWVIEKTRFDKNDPSDYGKLFWIKKCDGSFKLHANTFKMLQKLYVPKDSSENRFILSNIQSYLEYLGGEKKIEDNLNEEEKVKLMANLAYFAEQYKYNPSYSGGSRIMGRLRFFLSEADITILEKNNYFNLPQFKEWWDNADYDEYFVEECEYNGACGKDYQPLNSTEWRKQHPKK